jgi:hypothetical protein
MGYPAKLMNLTALLAKLESTYGTAVAVTSTADGHLLALSDRFPGLLSMNYAYDGSVGPAPGNLGMLKRVAAVGRTVSGQIPMRAKGAATTYAATVLPNIHTMLKISGFDSTLSSGTYTYTPTVDGITYSSATMEYYKRGEKWTARGVIAEPGFQLTGPGMPIWTFDIRGIADTAVADSAVVAPTYPTLTTAEPIATGITLSIGSYTAGVVKACSFKMNRSIDNPRLNLLAADAHEGFVPNGYDPEFRVTVESTALTYPNSSSGFDPYKARLNGEAFAIALVVGSTAYNRWKFNMAQAQVVDYSMNNDGPVATTELVFKSYNSSPIVQTDACSIVFD